MWVSAAFFLVAAIVTTVVVIVNSSGDHSAASNSGGGASFGLAGMTVSPDGQHLCVSTVSTVNPLQVSIIDTTTWQPTVETLSRGLTPDHRAGLAVTPDGAHLYFAGEVTTPSVTTLATDDMAESTIPIVGGPAGTAVSPKGDRAYFITWSPAGLVSVDTAAGVMAGAPIVLEEDPKDLVVSPDGAHVYVGGRTYVQIIDTVANKITGKIQACADELAINPAGDHLYALCDSTSEVTNVDLSANTAAPIDINGGAGAVAVGGNGFVYIAYAGSSTMAVVDPATGQLVGEPIVIESGARTVVADPANNRLYTANGNGSIYLVDTTTNSARKLPVRWSG